MLWQDSWQVFFLYAAQQIADETGWLLKRQWDFFAADVINSAVPVQDTVHIGTIPNAEHFS